MSRFLFVVPPLTGHTNPTVAVGQQLRARGHAVAWTGHAKVIRPLLPADAELIPLGEDPDDDDPVLAQVKQRSQGLRGAEALLFLWEEFLLPLGRSMVPGVEAAVAQFHPDVLVVDQQAIAGAVVARRAGLRWATSATTSAELVDPFDLLPKLGEWVAEALRQFQADFGVVGGDDIRFSEHLVLAFSTEALAGEGRSFPSHYRFVGPSLGARPATVEFPWDWIDPSRRLVMVSLGTINAPAGRRFLVQAVAALAALADRIQGVVVGPPDLVEEVPDNVLIRGFVPQLDLLERVDAVVSHGGHNTVCEALAHGLPLVVAPIRDDQPIVAQQLTDAGAAIRVRFGRVGATELAAAMADVLDRPSYRRAAQRIGASFHAAGGPAAAARGLETLASREHYPLRQASTR
ncbi:MAG: glycosyltransferase [Actinomycetota bacterium]|nr:glycosyltransferase [Actinomycetota bacterium]